MTYEELAALPGGTRLCLNSGNYIRIKDYPIRHVEESFLYTLTGDIVHASYLIDNEILFQEEPK